VGTTATGALYRRRSGEWGTGHGRRHAGARHGGHGARTAVGRCGVAGNGPAAVLVGGACTSGMRPAVKQGRAGTDRWAPLQSRAAAV
jgi:hypothetical protein